jgi:Na+/H+ antiporter NhaC
MTPSTGPSVFDGNYDRNCNEPGSKTRTSIPRLWVVMLAPIWGQFLIYTGLLWFPKPLNARESSP